MRTGSPATTAQPPSLLALCIDALTRRELPAKPTHGSIGGSFWTLVDEQKYDSIDSVVLSPLPLPPSVKVSTIQTLRRAGCMTDEALIRLTDRQQEVLVVSSCRSLSGASLSALHLLCPHLTCIDLSWCCQLTSDDVAGLRLLPYLRALSLRGCHRLDSAALAAVLSPKDESETSAVALEVLRAENALPVSVPNEQLQLVTAQTPSAWLTILDLACSNVDASMFSALANSSPALRVLLLRDAPALDDAHVATFLQRCPHLEHLDLMESRANALRGVGWLDGEVESASLHTLRVSGIARKRPDTDGVALTRRVSTQLVRAVRQGLGQLLRGSADAAEAFPRLARFEFHMRSSRFVANMECQRVLFEQMLRSAPNLESMRLVVPGPAWYHPPQEPHSLPLSCLPLLKELSINTADVVGTNVLERCPNIVILRCYGMNLLGGPAFPAAVQNLKHLRELILVDCTEGCSDDMIAHTLAQMPERIHVSLDHRNSQPHGDQPPSEETSWHSEAVASDRAALALWAEDYGYGSITA